MLLKVGTHLLKWHICIVENGGFDNLALSFITLMRLCG